MKGVVWGIKYFQDTDRILGDSGLNISDVQVTRYTRGLRSCEISRISKRLERLCYIMKELNL